MSNLHRTVVLLFITANGFCQTVLDRPLNSIEQQPLAAFLQEVELKYSIKAFYLDDWLANYEVAPKYNGYSLRRLLDELLSGSGITYDFLFGYALIFSKDPASAIARENALQRANVRRKRIEQKVIGRKDKYRPGVAIVLSGLVNDQDTHVPLKDATILVNYNEEVVTDGVGRFVLHLLPGAYAITIQHAGYDDHVIDLEIYADGDLDIRLQETPVLLEEVVISDEHILDRSIGKTDLNMTHIRRAPVFLGEVDVIKQVQMQPGVTTVGEIASGFNVRGGSVDQNLVLYDGVPVFNTSHALGFFTAFNPEAIGGISFYRGGIPAEYGGRASSVLNIVSKEGDYSRWTGAGGLGITSSHFTVGGPVKRDTTSLMLSVRSTYSNWMLDALKSNYEDVRNTSVRFYDGALKFTHRLSDRSKLTFSGYSSNDAFSLADDTTYYWRNALGALTLHHAFKADFISTISLGYGRYDFTVSEDDPATAFDLRYSITYPTLKIDFQMDGDHNISFGLHNTYYRFSPGRLQPSSIQSNTPFHYMPEENALESAAYISDGFNLSDRWYIEAGLRYSLFNRLGPNTVYKYDGSGERDVDNIIDSVRYESGQISKTYTAPEPRLSLRYTVGLNSSLKFGYHRMVQYIHLITNTAAITPTDIWQSSNNYFEPQIVDQLSAGIFRNFRDNMFEVFTEVYWKELRNGLDFKDGANLILNPHLETALVKTSGKAYGLELSASKTKGRLQASVNYTYSRSFRRSQSDLESEQINNRRSYPANHDQPHVANLNWRYGISRRIYFSGNFVYHTGRPVSMPSTVYEVDGVPVSGFSERNQYRIPDYHRLDVAFIIEGNHKRKKFLDGNWVFSFYNAYARRNAYSVFFADDGSGFLRPYRLSVIGTVIPSISYSFKFPR